MQAGRALRQARHAARMSQRRLAALAGVPQSTVARIEGEMIVPRVDTFERLLHAAGHQLEVSQRPGFGVDRTQIRSLLRLTPDVRLRVAVASASNVCRLLKTVRRSVQP